jgi:hypothetical protein
LRAELNRLFGCGHLEIIHFAHCPYSHAPGRRGVWPDRHRRRTPWRPPGLGVPVLVVSDFTVTTPVYDADYAILREWLEFAEAVVAAGCHPIGLIPYPPSRWPSALTRAMTFVHWSERTTARQIMRALRESAVARKVGR